MLGVWRIGCPGTLPALSCGSRRDPAFSHEDKESPRKVGQGSDCLDFLEALSLFSGKRIEVVWHPRL